MSFMACSAVLWEHPVPELGIGLLPPFGIFGIIGNGHGVLTRIRPPPVTFTFQFHNSGKQISSYCKIVFCAVQPMFPAGIKAPVFS